MSIRKTVLLIAAAIVCVPSAVIALSSDAEARSFGGRSSFSTRSYSRSYSKPSRPSKPAPAPKKVVKVEKTTVVQNNMINQGSSGGGFMSTLLGTTGGVVAGNAISDMMQDDPVEQVQEVLPEIEPPIDIDAGKIAPVCPENFICDFENKKFYDITKGKLIEW